MSDSWRLAPRAAKDLEEIVDQIALESGSLRAESFLSRIVDAAEKLSRMPGMGHIREDLTARPVVFWPVLGFLVVYRPDTAPLEIVRVLHGARDPEALEGEIER